MRPHIAHWIWSLTLGGDAKNLSALALAQEAWADVTILTRSDPAGIRASDLEAKGITVIPGVDSIDRLTEWVDNSPPGL